jgi:2-polyprenyl-6-methoxyphenol hydroxylase-like FAD-dependent oxidoreductase
MRIAVIGGGPAGLLFGALVRERRPDVDVTVFERNMPDATYGFGVVFSASTLRRLTREDERLGRELRAAATHWDRMELRLDRRAVSCGGMGFSAVARRRLLDLLQDRAVEAGVDLRFEVEADAEALEAEYDLVVGADGVNSSLRSRHEIEMRSELELATAKYIWFGAAKAFEHMTFLFEKTDAGWFAVHAYPYDRDLSTFVVECDPQTWRRSGFDAFDASAPAGVSDEVTRAAMQELFADALGGAELLANNSRWLSFRTLRVGSWVNGSAVLAGDAAHTAHFSVGSGTTMALEDAVALAAGVSEVSSTSALADALERYEITRRPSVARVQDAATPSRTWWERFALYAEQFDLEQLSMHFLTRSGRVSARRLAESDPAFFVGAAGGDVASVTERVLAAGPYGARSPLATIVAGGAPMTDLAPAAGIVLPDGAAQAWIRGEGEGPPVAVPARWVTSPTSPDPHAGVAATAGLPEQALLVVRRAGNDLDARTAQVVLAESARLNHGASVVLVDDDADLDGVVTTLLTQRADAVAVGAAALGQLADATSSERELMR